MASLRHLILHEKDASTVRHPVSTYVLLFSCNYFSSSFCSKFWLMVLILVCRATVFWRSSRSGPECKLLLPQGKSSLVIQKRGDNCCIEISIHANLEEALCAADKIGEIFRQTNRCRRRAGAGQWRQWGWWKLHVRISLSLLWALMKPAMSKCSLISFIICHVGTRYWVLLSHCTSIYIHPLLRFMKSTNSWQPLPVGACEKLFVLSVVKWQNALILICLFSSSFFPSSSSLL